MSEILAPAGGKNSAFAAINSGADALYLGLDKFSARSSAENFDGENFKSICEYAHIFGVKVYAALNTVIKQSELESFFNAAVTAWNTGADALIIQDIFLGKYLKQKFPFIKLHLSTQAGTCNEYGALLAKEYGFDRVILARETRLEDIKKICKIIETEVFVQGALCTCFSGQCYMSSFAGGNSGNRGRCKQPCRKLYSIDRAGFEEQAYRLSLSDLSVGEDIKTLIEAGVASFKIEGRMRRPEYVAAAVNYYRNLLYGGNADLSELKRTYNRGNYTKGLAFGQGKSFISSAVQGHIGEFVGIIKVENSKYICQSKLKFAAGDGFKVLRNGKEVGGGAYGGEANGGFLLSTRARLKSGDKVFITTDVALNQKLLSAKKSIYVKIYAEFLAGKPAFAKLGNLEIIGDEPLEKAQKRPLSQEEILRNFQKVDGLPFTAECTVKTDGVFMAASALNSFRRKVYEGYFNYLAASNNIKAEGVPSLALPVSESNFKTAEISGNLNSVNAQIGILKPDDYNADLKQLIKDFSGEKFLFVPPFTTGEEIQNIISATESFDGIYCDNYFGLKLAQTLNKKFFAGVGFNITNAISLEECKADYICLSKELTASEINVLSKSNAFALCGGGIKVMDLIYCPFEKKCSSCDRRSEYTLTDENGRKFPLKRYKTSECRFEVYNCASLLPFKSNAGRLCDNTVKPDGNFTKGHSVVGID